MIITVWNLARKQESQQITIRTNTKLPQNKFIWTLVKWKKEELIGYDIRC